MKKALSFILDYSWLLKLGIWLGIILWAAQAGSFFYGEFLKIKNKPGVSVEERVKLNKEMNEFAQVIRERAKLNKDNYKPKDYFNDLYEIQIKEDELAKKYGEPPFYDHVYELQAILESNREAKKFTEHQISIEAKAHSQRLQDRIPNEFHQQLKAMSTEEKTSFFSSGFQKLLDWLFKLYARGILLAWSLFLLRMRERKGVLATILGDKKMFALAFVFWPVLLVKYPSDLIKEIVVEAELRRIGDFFRRLSTEEKKVIRQVAESRDFFGWIRRFHRENSYLFRRSLAMGLLAVVMCNVFYSLECRGDTLNPVRAGTNIQLMIDDNLDDHHVEIKNICSHPEYALFLDGVIDYKIFPFPWGVLVFLETFFSRQEFVKRIEHIPLG